MDLKALRKQRGFVPLFIAQFGGALNDNIFRSAILILIAFELTQSASSTAILNNLALILFLLPMIILSPLAGQLADRADKSKMMAKNKIAEIVICLLATLAFALDSSYFMLFVLFLLGAQSAMFGPNKFAFLPQILPRHLILKGNAIVAAGSFIAITFGVLLGGMLTTLDNIWLIAGPIMLTVAVIGYRATLAFPTVARGNPELKIDANLFRQSIRGFQIGREDKFTWLSMLGLSWFWAFGSALLTQIPAYTRYVLGGDTAVVTALIAIFVTGLALGAFLSTRTEASRTEPGLIPVALMGLILSGFILAIDPPISTDMQGMGEIFSQWSGRQAGLGMLLFGTFGGLYLVPQYSLIQQRTNLASRARVIAATNLLNAVFMIAASVLGLVLLGFLEWSIQGYFALYCAASLFILALQLREFSHEFWRLIGYAISRTMYPIRVESKTNIPESGPALLVCNHLSYADAVVLFGTIDRRTRFIMEDIYHRIPVLNWAFRGARTIPIASPLKNRKIFQDAEDSAVEALQNGELVFIFPEGRLSPTGEQIAFKRGTMRILERHPVPVVPVAIKGLWGSYFSHGGGRPALKGFPKWRWRRRQVVVCFGEALQAEEVDLKKLEQQVSDLYQKIEL